MTLFDLEQLIDQMISGVKQGADVSAWKKNRKVSPLLTLIGQLNSFRKAEIEIPDFDRVRGQVLDRISVPAMETQPGWFASMLPRIMRAGVVTVGSLMIVISLVLGLSAAALNSLPGSAIYPLKQFVENIELKFTPDNQKATLQIKFANNRIDEIQQVLENQEQGKLSAEQAQKAISQTVKDLQKTTSAAASAAANQPKVANKLADLSNKLKTASIQTEGQVKIELEKAAEVTRISQEEAIKNIEHAGLKIEDKQIIDDSSITASGKLTAVSETTISLGTAKFFLSKTTEYVNVKAADLTVGTVVDIEGQIKDNKAYATKITLVSDTKTETPATEDNSATQ